MSKIIENDDYIEIISNKFKMKKKIAAFDLDGTLIKTKSGKPYPIDGEFDWEFNYSNIKDVLNNYLEDNFCIIIITNQKNLKKRGITEWCNKLKEIIKQLDIPIKVYASILDNIYRKPNIGFFEFFKNIDMEESFYCGDAMGRKGDHADTDLKFAMNCKLKFIPPEKIFSNKNILVNYNLDYFDFNNFEKNQINFYEGNAFELIIFVGFPGSGKSTFISKNLIQNNYNVISQDVSKTKNKCHKLCEQFMKEKKKIVIDNTNPSLETRMNYIDLAKKYNYNVRCFHMSTTENHSRHNAMYRYLYQNKPYIPSLVFNIYKKKYEKPTLQEGYSEIININPELPSKTNNSKYFYYLY
jgi:bifunctional polynucleotide phosphatase/kinase